ncbi:MAG: hypothetical protein CMP50_05205 [Flavobacteriales bacterium]|nr:hypothetical protein [Flavobacteriales bacterium]|tara:strand:- start:57 stop:509 length:453 start_codon:yes stop_codon:yes gene_type:complete
MPFFNRLSFFILGIIIGVSIIFISLQQRKDKLTFNYLPNNRVKSYLIKNNISFSPKSLCKMSCLGLDTISLNEYISRGSIDFKKSKIRGYTDKLYYLSFASHNINIREDSYLVFGTLGDSVTLLDVWFNFGTPSSYTSAHPGNMFCDHCY